MAQDLFLIILHNDFYQGLDWVYEYYLVYLYDLIYRLVDVYH